MKILFVCAGNINRSPAAEIIFNHHNNTPFNVCQSAGTSDKNKGRITNKRMRDALERNGYPYKEIRSKPVTQELIDWADLIYVMEPANHRKVIAKFGMPAILKLRMLNENGKIPDPHFQKDIQVYDECVKEIAFCINNRVLKDDTRYSHIPT